MNKQSFTGRWLVAATIGLSIVSIANAQISKLSDAEKATRGTAPPGANSGNGALPSTDPKDFSGSWRSGGGPGGGGPGGPPGGAGGMGAGGSGALGDGGPGGTPGAGFNPPGNAAVSGQLPARILCLPQDVLSSGVDGPTTIIQTPEEINWASEEMHHLRRIYLTGALPTNPTPSFLGVSVGHWEGNTLVVETVGLKSQKTGVKMIEKWSKSDDGKTLSISYGYVDAAGKATGNNRNMSMSWANGQETLEWICEDYNDEWLPGGADYDDQVGKKK